LAAADTHVGTVTRSDGSRHGKTKTFCVYDAADPEAIRRAAERNSLPVDRIIEVSVLDPYFYR
jgi:Nickel responsive protein SCO4226-like